jgi:probable HAF family extracellular repeat protein
MIGFAPGLRLKRQEEVMNTKMLKKAMTAGGLLALFAGVALGQEPAGPPSVNALSTRYLIQDLGIVGPVEGQPFVITANGYVAGLAVVPSGGASVSHAVYWHGTSMKDISYPGLGGTNSAAFGVNIWGQVVGEAENAKPDPNGEDFCGFQSLGFTSQADSCLPYLFQDGAMSALPTLRDDSGKSGVSGQAWQINTFGVAVGSSENTTSDTTCPGLPTSHQKFQFKPVVWYKLFPWSEERIHELSTVSGDPDGVALAVNERGEAAGGSGTCGPFNAISLFNLVPRHAILWQNGQPIDLGNLGGDGLFGGIYASGLNNVGQVVGLSDTTNDASFHGFLWEAGHMTDLQTLPGDSYSVATAISDRGVVLGVSIDANFNIRAFIWQNGNIQDLNKLVAGSTPLFLQTACSINALGEIDGIAFDPTTGEFHAYLATPILGNVDSDSSTSGVEGTSKANAKTLRQWRFGRLASQRSRTD